MIILSATEAMQAERKWHILLSVFLLLVTSGQCMDSKEVKQKERRTLLDLILQVIGDNPRDKPISWRYSSGLLTRAQDIKLSSCEKPLYVPRLDNSRPIGKLLRFIFRLWWKHNPHFTVWDSCRWFCWSMNRSSFLILKLYSPLDIKWVFNQ